MPRQRQDGPSGVTEFRGQRGGGRRDRLTLQTREPRPGLPAFRGGGGRGGQGPRRGGFAPVGQPGPGQPGPGQFGRLTDLIRQSAGGALQALRGQTWPLPGQRFGEGLFSIGPRSAAEGRAPAYRLQGPFYQNLRREAEFQRRLRAFGPGAERGRKGRRGIDDPAVTFVPLDEAPSYAGEGGGGFPDFFGGFPEYTGGYDGGGGGGGGGGDFPEGPLPPWFVGLTTWRV